MNPTTNSVPDAGSIPHPRGELPDLTKPWIFRMSTLLMPASDDDAWVYEIPAGYVMDVPTDLCVPFSEWLDDFAPHHAKVLDGEPDIWPDVPHGDPEYDLPVIEIEPGQHVFVPERGCASKLDKSITPKESDDLALIYVTHRGLPKPELAVAGLFECADGKKRLTVVSYAAWMPKTRDRLLRYARTLQESEFVKAHGYQHPTRGCLARPCIVHQDGTHRRNGTWEVADDCPDYRRHLARKASRVAAYAAPIDTSNYLGDFQ